MGRVKYLLTIISVGLICFAGCATNMPCCPPEDIVYLAETPMGLQFFPMKKGFLDKHYQDQHWVTKKEWEQKTETFDKWTDEYNKLVGPKGMDI